MKRVGSLKDIWGPCCFNCEISWCSALQESGKGEIAAFWNAPWLTGGEGIFDIQDSGSLDVENVIIHLFYSRVSKEFYLMIPTW